MRERAGLLRTRRMHRIASAQRAFCGLAVLAIGAALAGCQSMEQPGASTAGTGSNLEARLRAAGGSAATGVVMLRAYDGGVTLSVTFTGTVPGQYRVAVHENGNCTSANAFSAGPPWAPPGVAIASPVVFKSDDAALLVVRLPGYRFDGPDGVFGRSVVVHAGAQGSLEAQPGVPNNRIACGVIGAPTSLLPKT